MLHPALMALSLYPSWWGYGSTSDQSNQYAKISVALIVCAALLYRAARKRSRSIDRIFVSLLFTSIIVTSMIFHYVTRQGVKEAKTMQLYAMRLAASAPEAQFQAICEDLEAQCFSGNKKSPAILTGEPHTDFIVADLRKTFQLSSNHVAMSIGTSAPLSADPTDLGERPKTAHVYFEQQADTTFRVVIEKQAFQKMVERWTQLYATLALPAHLIWLFGGLYLVWWHKRRLRHRSTLENKRLDDLVERRGHEFRQG